MPTKSYKNASAETDFKICIEKEYIQKKFLKSYGLPGHNFYEPQVG